MFVLLPRYTVERRLDTPANPGEPQHGDTILVVDDDPQARVLLNSLLADDLGHQLVFAPDGEAGIARYEQTHPDVVITDLVMPRLSGILMIEYLTAIYPTSNLPQRSSRYRARGRGDSRGPRPPGQWRRSRSRSSGTSQSAPFRRLSLAQSPGRSGGSISPT